MLLAIDVGNSQATFGIYEDAWTQVWRRVSDAATTEDELAAWLFALALGLKIDLKPERIVVSSVVPAMDRAIQHLAERYFNLPPLFISSASDFGIPVEYDPPGSLGPDRLANALGALEFYKPPVLVIDMGTATTFDAVDKRGVFVGGAILPGPKMNAQALVSRSAKLPQIALKAPKKAIGGNTVEALQSGLVLAYAGGVEALIKRSVAELGPETTVIATGGDAELFAGECPSIKALHPHLTLDGLRVAASRLPK